MKLASTLLTVFLAFVTIAGAAEPMPPAKAETLEVEILVFSGRRNPTFVITDPAVIREITNGVKALSAHPTLKTNGSLGNPGRLGYRGIRLRNGSSVNSDLEWFTVFRSAVEVVNKAANSKEFRVDAAAALERRLIKMAEEKKLMDDVVLEHVKSVQ
jgi:hypothetical protein